MSLINCPECGKEVSDKAEMCPSCGYGVKTHFDKIKQEKERAEQAKQAEIKKKQAEIDAKKYEEERIKSVPELKNPQLTTPIVTLVGSALIFLMAKSELNATEWEVKRSMSQGHGDPHAFGVVFTLFSICLAFYGIYLFFKRLSDYNLSKTNFEEYQKQVIKERDKKAAAEIAHINAQIKKEMANRPKCPQCGSHNTEKISTLNRATSVAATGLASNKIGKLYKCKDCKHMW